MITSQFFTIFITLTGNITNPPLFFMINNALVDSEADLTSANEQSLHETHFELPTPQYIQ